MSHRTAHRNLVTAAALLGAALGAALLAGCTGSDDPEPTPTPSPSSTPSPARTATRTPTATPTATPDPLASAPEVAADAAAALDEYLAGRGPGCAEDVTRRWTATCLEGDLDADGAVDAAYLITLTGGATVATSPGVVLVDRAAVTGLEQFPVRDDADVSEMGASLFAIADRSGDGQPELTLLAMRCGASNCQGRLEVQSWDGTAWRDIGPGQPGFDNPESIHWDGIGGPSALVVRAGALRSVGAGPTRAAVVTYRLTSGVYQEAERDPDPPAYLFHAVLDADALFEQGDFVASIEAYEALIANEELRDWYADIGRTPGRPALEGYALFRIAVATAAIGEDPTAAMDRVILESQEPLFAQAIQAFRRGYQDSSSVPRGCIEATRYLLLPEAEAVIDDRFDYGYGNPRKAPEDICPL